MSKAKRREQQRRRAAFVATIGKPCPTRAAKAPYVDPIAVERACWGDKHVYLRPLERRAAVQQLTSRRLTAREIAERLGVTPRTVVRHRSRPLVEVSAFGA